MHFLAAKSISRGMLVQISTFLMFLIFLPSWQKPACVAMLISQRCVSAGWGWDVNVRLHVAHVGCCATELAWGGVLGCASRGLLPEQIFERLRTTDSCWKQMKSQLLVVS